MKKVFNFYGPPGSGNSTMALGFTAFLKRLGLDAEYVGEFLQTQIAIHNSISDQLEILVQQNKLLRSYYNNADYIVTDAPILNSLIYIRYPNNQESQILGVRRHIELLAHKLYQYYNNVNILVSPCPNRELYKESLRNQTWTESILMYQEFLALPIEYDMKIEGFSSHYSDLDLYKSLIDFI